ncbi:hypothetical protein HD554DRAFT_2055898 [Boletus coccyginus]|nr:hypothetical protein HD554DRAFT_2055898 [Boletus coccyginus]
MYWVWHQHVWCGEYHVWTNRITKGSFHCVFNTLIIIASPLWVWKHVGFVSFRFQSYDTQRFSRSFQSMSLPRLEHLQERRDKAIILTALRLRGGGMRPRAPAKVSLFPPRAASTSGPMCSNDLRPRLFIALSARLPFTAEARWGAWRDPKGKPVCEGGGHSGHQVCLLRPSGTPLRGLGPCTVRGAWTRREAGGPAVSSWRKLSSGGYRYLDRCLFETV